MTGFLVIDGTEIGCQQAQRALALNGSLQASISGKLFSNITSTKSATSYATHLMSETEALNWFKYLLGNGECFPFTSADATYFHQSNKGNEISAVNGTVSSVTTVGFANQDRAISVSSGGHAEFSTVLGEHYTVIVQYGGSTTTNRGTWNTIVMSSKHPNGGLYGGVFSATDTKVNNHITIVSGRVRLRGRNTAGTGNAIAYYSNLVIIPNHALDLQNDNILSFVANQTGNAAGVVPYAGEYPQMIIQDSGERTYLGKSDPASLSISTSHYEDDEAGGELSFSILEDKQ